MHALDAALEQAEHHRARRPAGPQHQCVRGTVPPGRAGVEIIDKTFDVGVGRTQLAVLVPQRIGRADRAGTRVRPGQRQRALLVRNGDVGADKAVRRQMQHELGKALGRHRLDDCSRPRCQASAASNDGSAASANAPPAIRSGMRRGLWSRRSLQVLSQRPLIQDVVAAQIGQAGSAVNAIGELPRNDRASAAAASRIYRGAD